MFIEVYKYQAAGNDFIMIDGRVSNGKNTRYIDDKFIKNICHRRYGIGADGLIVLEDSETCDFKMRYYNSDGTSGMMCGNGARATVAFAAYLGYASFCFEGSDGVHHAEILSDGTVCVEMKNVDAVKKYDDLSWCLDTGTQHLVKFVNDLHDFPVLKIGAEIRWRSEFAPIGINVNFIEFKDSILRVRTYEKGVENETYACGTGAVASCIVAYINGVKPTRIEPHTGRVYYDIYTLHDVLTVGFVPSEKGGMFNAAF